MKKYEFGLDTTVIFASGLDMSRLVRKMHDRVSSEFDFDVNRKYIRNKLYGLTRYNLYGFWHYELIKPCDVEQYVFDCVLLDMSVKDTLVNGENLDFMMDTNYALFRDVIAKDADKILHNIGWEREVLPDLSTL